LRLRFAPGALTGRAHARKGPPAMFGMPLSAPAGQTSQGTMRVPRRTNWHPSGLTKVYLAGEREQVIVCAKLSCMTGRSGTRKPVEFPVICVPIPVLIHRRRNHVSRWLSSPFEAVDCSHFGRVLQPFQQSLLRPGISGNCDCFIGTVRWFVSIAPRGTPNQFDNSSRVAIQDDPYPKCTSIIDGDRAPETDGELVCNLGFDCPGESHSKGQLGGYQIEALATLTMAGIAIGFRAELEGGPVRYLRTIVLAKWPPSVGPRFCQPGPIWLANSTAMPRPTAPSWQVKSARDSPPHTATISPLLAAVSTSAFDSATRGVGTTPWPSEAARQKADQLSQITKANK